MSAPKRNDDYKQARGCAPRKEGDPLPEEVIATLRERGKCHDCTTLRAALLALAKKLESDNETTVYQRLANKLCAAELRRCVEGK